ncbi:hypothetical protein DPMN_107087 [Dreissena polymorpha]|uniref:Uncharacterized protein n=2 Tax=Dreissena polymorpha TaxID=45954 RepID=A0A9D4K6G5_DREPO|nr:hypothetical protein DPMN_107087 [Dreissena polymorpha]
MVNAAGARSLPMPDLKKALLTQRELAEQLKPKVAPIFSSLLEEGKGRQLGNTSNTPQGREQTTHGRFGNHKGRDFSGPFGGEGNIASPENDGPESNFNNSDCERLLKEISQQAGGTDEIHTYKDNSEESKSNRNNLSANIKHLKDKTRINKSSLSYTKDDYAVLDTPNNMRMKKSNSGIYNDSLDSKTLKFSHKIKDESVKRVKSMYGKQRKTTTRSNLVEEKNLFGVEGEKNSEEREDEISAALSGGLEDIDILSRDKRKVLGSRLRIRRRDKIEDE